MTSLTSFDLPRHRTGWRVEAFFLAALAVGGTALFTFTDLDVVWTRPFYDPSHPFFPWPDERFLIWRFFYYAAPIVTALLALGALGGILAGTVRRHLRPWRMYGLFMILIVAIGPGVIINGIFKNNWGRPRPRQVEAFGGSETYRPPLLPGPNSDCKSFPCGHSSVGYAFVGLWMIWRRRRPSLAWSSLLGGYALGTLMGIGRTAAGGHWPSDVLWSAIFTHGTALALYYGVMRIPQRELRQALEGGQVPDSSRRLSTLEKTGLAVLMAGVLIGVALATPLSRDIRLEAGADAVLPCTAELTISQAAVELHLAEGQPAPLQVFGYVRAFGMPTNRLKVGSGLLPGTQDRIWASVESQGVFTDFDSALTVIVDPDKIAGLKLTLHRGHLRVAPFPEHLQKVPELNFNTMAGQVEWLDPDQDRTGARPD